jgi:glucose 1-dehydrogenase
MMIGQRFVGKAAIVTGAAAGIGRACVERLAQEGAQVLLTDWHAVRGERAAEEIAASGRDVRFLRHDAGDKGSWRDTIATAREMFGPLHVLVNNAYSGVAVSFEALTAETLGDAMRVNAAGALIGMQLAADAMTEGGAIVNVSSIAAFYPSSSNLAYATSKAAVLQLTGSAALALAGRTPQIRVNAVAPGAIDTHTLRSAVRALNKVDKDADLPEGLKSFASDAVLGRVGTVEEVAAAVCFLAADEASYITGQCLRVDGGVF